MFTTQKRAHYIANLLAAFGILVGDCIVQPFGKLGILAWLQSVVLITPWLLFFWVVCCWDLHQFCGHPVLLVASTALYIKQST